ncbi:MAG: YgjV family protein [Clostridia bacterium]|nr:YgjV family protein [Clostridia bacterium]
MIEWTTTYIASQILVIIVYVCLCTTYFLKDRKKILILNLFAHIIQAISFLLLGGMTGVAMNGVYVARDILFITEKNKDTKAVTKKDIIILVCFILLIIIFTLFTYDGLLSLLSVIATIISTFAIWQKNTKLYKVLGIPTSIAWLGYHISLNSVFAITLEGVLLISTIIGYILEVLKNKKNK